MNQCVVEITDPESMFCNSSINTKDSANYLNHMVSKFGLEHHLELEDNKEFSFDLTNQVTLQVGADGGGILDDNCFRVFSKNQLRTGCLHLLANSLSVHCLLQPTCRVCLVMQLGCYQSKMEGWFVLTILD